MAKFKMECDKCGQPIEVRTGFFAPEWFTCECGYMTKAKRIGEEVCPQCRDHMIRFDRKKEAFPKCPSCGYTIDREARFQEAIEVEAEKRLNGVERSPFITVDLSHLFKKNSDQDNNDASDN